MLQGISQVAEAALGRLIKSSSMMETQIVRGSASSLKGSSPKPQTKNLIIGTATSEKCHTKVVASSESERSGRIHAKASLNSHQIIKVSNAIARSSHAKMSRDCK